ncbi:MAG: hypothetical protein K6E30_08860 [Lachnospiraceae bacterium]|nr:hypothetical protein [Lachnospiraceae bacterium]
MSTHEFENKVRRLKSLKNRQESLQQEIDQLQDDLMHQMDMMQAEEMQAGPFRVTFKWIDSTRFDDERFRDDHDMLYKLYSVRNSYRKFAVV